MSRRHRRAANDRYTRVAIGIAIFSLIAPWLVWFFTLPPNATPELVAVPAYGPGLSARVAADFADAPYFVLVGLASRRVRTIENPDRSQQAVGIRSAHRVLDEGAGVLLVRNLRREALGTLDAQGVRVFTGAGGSVAELVQAFVAGGLTPLLPATEPPGSLPDTQAAAIARRPGEVPELGLRVALGSAGLLIVDVSPSSRAARAGVRHGDLLLALGQTPVQSVQQVDQAAGLILPDRPVLAWLQRDGTRAGLWIPP